MSGFSTSRSGFGIDNIAKQYGSILRGWGPPVPKAGVVGDLYIDNLTFQFFEKRRINSLDDWGHYLFLVPTAYKNTLKWFGASRPSDTIGVPGDVFVQWSGYDNYGMQLSIFGPKLIVGWPENGGDTGNGGLPIAEAKVRPLGVLDEGTPLTDVAPNQLIAVGVFEEYVIPLTVTANPGEPIAPIGVPSTGTLVSVTINPLYTAVDTHAV